MNLLSLLWSCVCGGSTSPVVSSPSIVQPDRAIVVRVEGYREEDLSKVQGREKFHSYVELALLEGDASIQAHAKDGRLQVNMLTTTLAQAGPVPLTVGQELDMTVVINATSPPYVLVKKLQARAQPQE